MDTPTDRQMDRQTERRGSTLNAAPREGCIITKQQFTSLKPDKNFVSKKTLRYNH